MGRKRLFCQQQALGQILCLFWRKGFDATSIRDIATALDVPIASLYHCYGDKKAILQAALDDYEARYITPAINRLTESDDPLGALDDFFTALAHPAAENDQPPGCFLVLVAEQCHYSEPTLAQQARAILGKLKASFASNLERARPDANHTALAQVLLAHMIALKTLERMPDAGAIIRDYLDYSIRPLLQGRS